MKAKRKRWKAKVKKEEKAGKFLGTHMIPVVLGPKKISYVIDHHHLCRALLEEGVEDLLVNVVADLSTLKKTEFWIYLDNRDWCHAYDGEGRRRDFDASPASIAKLTDDPYRSLAGELRRMGGFAKDITPFSEFIWADFLRRRVKPKLVDEDFPAAMKRALKLAKSDAAGYLPGWCGPNPIV